MTATKTRISNNAAGRAYRSIDNLGRIDETHYDGAGRTVRTIENYDDFDPQNGVEEDDTDRDVVVEYEYSAGRLATLTAYNAKGTGNGVESQATKYLYGSSINASWQTAVVYPDSDDELTQNQTTKVWSFTDDNGDHVSTDWG